MNCSQHGRNPPPQNLSSGQHFKSGCAICACSQGGAAWRLRSQSLQSDGGLRSMRHASGRTGTLHMQTLLVCYGMHCRGVPWPAEPKTSFEVLLDLGTPRLMIVSSIKAFAQTHFKHDRQWGQPPHGPTLSQVGRV